MILCPKFCTATIGKPALAVVYLRNDAVLRDELKSVKTVYTIHNIAYQGQFGVSEMSSTFALPQGWYDGGLGYEFQGRHDINLMKGAMLMADAVSTVSPTYARELHYPYYAHGLQGVVDMVDHKLYGILNGIDEEHYDPAHDPLIPYPFTSDDRSARPCASARFSGCSGWRRSRSGRCWPPWRGWSSKRALSSSGRSFRG